MNIIEINQLNKIYGKNHILKDLSIQVEQGEFLGIIGKSGSGKSTLINIIGALDSDYSGEYVFERRNISKCSDKELATIRNKDFGFVFQMYNLVNHYSVKDNIILPLLYSNERKFEDDYYRVLLDRLNLVELEHKKVIDLSGGEKQRVAIARAAINRPKLIIADEPTGNLDPNNTNDVINMFKYFKELGTTIIMVTHNMDVVKKCDRTLKIVDGKLI